MKTIVLDAGHGGKDSGAVNQEYNLLEDDIVFDICNDYLEPILDNWGYNILQTRTVDERIPFSERTGLANENDADLVVSVHLNGFSKPAANGSEVLYWKSSGTHSVEGKKAAELIQKRLVNNLDQTNRGIKGRSNLAILNGTSMPAVLVEPLFITNTESAELLKSGEWFKFLIAHSIAEGIRDYFDNN